MLLRATLNGLTGRVVAHGQPIAHLCSKLLVMTIELAVNVFIRGNE